MRSKSDGPAKAGPFTQAGARDIRRLGRKEPEGLQGAEDAGIEPVAAHILTKGRHTRLDATFAELRHYALEGIQFGGIGTL
jgi:hypothetical protein